MTRIEDTPLGWEINALFLLAHCCSKLTVDIDMQLKIMSGNTDGFIKKKSKALKEHEDNIKKACVYLQKADEALREFGLEKSTYESVHNSNKRYTNVNASANQLIQVCMLAMDRSHCDGGDARVFKRLRSLPENGIFPESFIERFQMKYEILPEKGDRIRNANHGDGTLEFSTGNGNWQCVFDNGDKVILHENQFKIL